MRSDDGSAQYDVSPQGTLIYQTQPGGVAASIVEVDVATLKTRPVTQLGPIARVG